MSTLRSEFANDAEMAAIIVPFVAGLPGKVAAMNGMLAAGQLAELRRAVHQLKGAGGGYGFAVLTAAAARVEVALKAGAAGPVVAKELGDLIQLMRSVEGYNAAGETAAPALAA